MEIKLSLWFWFFSSFSSHQLMQKTHCFMVRGGEQSPVTWFSQSTPQSRRLCLHARLRASLFHSTGNSSLEHTATILATVHCFCALVALWVLANWRCLPRRIEWETNRADCYRFLERKRQFVCLNRNTVTHCKDKHFLCLISWPKFAELFLPDVKFIHSNPVQLNGFILNLMLHAFLHKHRNSTASRYLLLCNPQQELQILASTKLDLLSFPWK